MVFHIHPLLWDGSKEVTPTRKEMKEMAAKHQLPFAVGERFDADAHLALHRHAAMLHRHESALAKAVEKATKELEEATEKFNAAADDDKKAQAQAQEAQAEARAALDKANRKKYRPLPTYGHTISVTSPFDH